MMVGDADRSHGGVGRRARSAGPAGRGDRRPRACTCAGSPRSPATGAGSCTRWSTTATSPTAKQALKQAKMKVADTREVLVADVGPGRPGRRDARAGRGERERRPRLHGAGRQQDRDRHRRRAQRARSAHVDALQARRGPRGRRRPGPRWTPWMTSVAHMKSESTRARSSSRLAHAAVGGEELRAAVGRERVPADGEVDRPGRPGTRRPSRSRRRASRRGSAGGGRAGRRGRRPGGRGRRAGAGARRTSASRISSGIDQSASICSSASNVLGTREVMFARPIGSYGQLGASPRASCRARRKRPSGRPSAQRASSVELASRAARARRSPPRRRTASGNSSARLAHPLRHRDRQRDLRRQLAQHRELPLDARDARSPGAGSGTPSARRRARPCCPSPRRAARASVRLETLLARSAGARAPASTDSSGLHSGT